jgi:hypothetical protein
LRDGTFFDWPDRFSRDAVEDVDEALLGNLGNRLDLSFIDSNLHQIRRSGKVVIP